MLALACQVDGLVALDAQLRPLRPAIIWLDRRATEQSARLSDAVGRASLTARTGLNPDASHTAPKAMWLHDHEPDHYARSRWLAPPGGHLNGWLTGEVVQDHANASSTLLYDLTAREWSSELIGYAGLDEARLPPIRTACDVLGPLRPEAAAALDLWPGCRVAVGTGDDHAAAVGAGAVCEGIVVDVCGTAEPVVAPSARLMFDDQHLVETHAHAVDGMMLIENPGFASGGSTSWWARAHGIPQSDVFALAALAPPGSDGVLFVPALIGSTTPRWNERMRGCFAGLGLHHDRAHMARAILEGCTFALRDIVDRFAAMGLAGEELRVVGGGARSSEWLQIKADVTGRPIRALAGEHATSSGAAMVAGVAAGWFEDLGDAAANTVRVPEERVYPQPAVAEIYEDAYRAYRRLFDALEAASDDGRRCRAGL
jgi:xylulokinase